MTQVATPRRFELTGAYGSVSAMSCQLAQGRREAAPIASTALIFDTYTNSLGETANPVIEHESDTAQDIDIPWQVVVHNDPINLMSYVTMVFQKVFGFSREKAEKHMLEVHREGRSVVWSGLRERAELYVQQLHGYLLLATLERVA